MVRVRVGYIDASGQLITPAPEHHATRIDFKSCNNPSQINDGLVKGMINSVLADYGTELSDNISFWWAVTDEPLVQ